MHRTSGEGRRLPVAQVALLAALAAFAAPSAANAAVNVKVLTGSVGGVDARGVVETQYTTRAQLNIDFNRNGAGSADDTVVVTPVAGTPDPGFQAGAGCVRNTARRVTCDGRMSAKLKLDVRSVTVQAFGTGPATNDFIRVRGDGLFAPRAPGLELRTGPGNDTIDVSGAEDTAGAVTDAVLGNSWNLRGGDGDDTLIGGGRDDVFDGGAGDDVLRPRERVGFANDLVQGGLGADLVDYTGNAPGVQVFANLATGQIDADGQVELAGVEGVLGSPAADTLTGSGNDETFDGRGGDDVIRAGGGDDLVLGGAGADRLHGDEGDDNMGGFRDVGPPELNAPDPPGQPDIPGQLEDLDDAQLGDLRDTFDGGDGADVIRSQGDGLREFPDCGANGTRSTTVIFQGRPLTLTIQAGDQVFADLVDEPDDDCESVTRADRFERAAVVMRPVGGSRAGLRMALTCPRVSLVPCAGRAGLVAGASRRLRDGVAYRIARGATRVLTLALEPGTRLGRGTPLRAIAIERGARRERTVSVLLNARRGSGAAR